MPVRGRKFHQKNRGVSICKSHLNQHLGWLPGYPLGQMDDSIRWMTISIRPEEPSHEIDLTAEHLQLATQTWTKLTSEYPHALPSVIGNLGRWHSHLPHLLKMLISAIDDQLTLSSNLFAESDIYVGSTQRHAKQLLADWPKGEPILEAFSWLHYLRPQHAEKSLNWLSSDRDILGGLLHKSSQKGLTEICEKWERRLTSASW